MSDARVALVTGAAHGQGRASALALAREGYRIAALDVAMPLAYPGYQLGSPDELASLARECEELGAACRTFAASYAPSCLSRAQPLSSIFVPARRIGSDIHVQSAWERPLHRLPPRGGPRCPRGGCHG